MVDSKAVVVVCDQPELVEQAQSLAQQLKLSCFSIAPNNIEFALMLSDQGLSLCAFGKNAPGPLSVDFADRSLDYRSQRGNTEELLAKALGVSGQHRPGVWDVTAGLGRDAWLLASLGCDVRMFERHPLVHALLRDGLERAVLNSQASSAFDIARRLTLDHRDSINALSDADLLAPDIIYLDPMFPEKRKQAKAKKTMQYFQALIGADEDGEILLSCALNRARYRVIAKRPLSASPLSSVKPSAQLKGKTVRYDIYALKSFDGYLEEKNNITR